MRNIFLIADNWNIFLKYKFSSNRKIEWIDRARTHAKQSLLREPWPLPFDREIPGVRQNLDPKFYVPQSLGTVRPAHRLHLTYVCAATATDRRPYLSGANSEPPKRLEPGCHHRYGSHVQRSSTELHGRTKSTCLRLYSNILALVHWLSKE